MTTDQPLRTCAHEGCSCTVPPQRTYCSADCANAAAEHTLQTGESRCTCGHPQCRGNAAPPPSS